jgi:hypothetical protein
VDIFISYRRADAPGSVRLLYDRLARRYGQENVYRDLHAVRAAEDFKKSIGAALKKCKIVIFIVGPKWVELERQQRLEKRDDWVRFELGMALLLNIPIIPVLVDGTTMPSKDDLREALASLAYLQAVEIDPLQHFEQDLERLFAVIDGKIPAGVKQAEPSPEARQLEPSRISKGEAVTWTGLGALGTYLWDLWDSTD